MATTASHAPPCRFSRNQLITWPLHKIAHSIIKLVRFVKSKFAGPINVCALGGEEMSGTSGALRFDPHPQGVAELRLSRDVFAAAFGFTTDREWEQAGRGGGMKAYVMRTGAP